MFSDSYNTRLSKDTLWDAENRSKLFELMSPADVEKADKLLSTWILDDLLGDKRLIGRYVGSLLDAMNTRINAL